MQDLTSKTRRYSSGSVDSERKERLGDVAYKAVLQGLFDRRVPAGAFISQSELVEILGVPIQPLREALRVLETEGVLKILPRSGIQFIKPDLDLMRCTYQFRTAIECMAIRKFAITGDIKLIQNLLDDHLSLKKSVEEKGIENDTLERLDELEQGLHGSIIENLDNPLIENTGRRLKNYITLIRLDTHLTAPLILQTLGEHIAILEACCDRDKERAEAAIVEHFQEAMRRNLGMF